MNDRKFKNRKSTRYRGYDYSQFGSNFVTICTHHRKHLFGKITDGKMELNEMGLMVRDEWLRSTEIRQEIEMDNFTVMPNHFHAIVVIRPSISQIPVGVNGVDPNISKKQNVLRIGRPETGRPPVAPTIASRSLGSLIGGFKSSVTKRINNHDKIWQRNYHDRIIRNEREYERIAEYISRNPEFWQWDQENRNEIPVNEKNEFWRKFYE